MILQRAQTTGTPLIENDQVTFVWQGKTAPLLIGDFNAWGWADGGPTTLQQVEPMLWTATLTFPPTAYLEYNFTTDWQDNTCIVRDPFNPRLTPSGIGHDNHYFDMPAAQHTSLVRRKKGVPKGTVTKHLVEHATVLVGGKRDVWLYQPPTTDPAPLLLVYDGRDYLKRAKLTEIVDNLIAEKRIPPLALAMIDNAKHNRMVEYNHGEAALGAVGIVVLPLAQKHLHLVDPQDGAYGVLGASMGGLMALYTGLRMPEIFGHVISQSGAFMIGSFIGSEPLIETLVKTLPRPDLKVWCDVGQFEWLLDANRHMGKVLHEREIDLTYREYAGGHNYTCWRDMLPQALETLFGD